VDVAQQPPVDLALQQQVAVMSNEKLTNATDNISNNITAKRFIAPL
jgi:hypothetical protein